MYVQGTRGGNTETEQHEEFREEILQELRSLLTVQYGQPDVEGAIRRIGEELETRDEQIEMLEGQAQAAGRSRGGMSVKVKQSLERVADNIRDQCDEALDEAASMVKERYGEAPSQTAIATQYGIILNNLAQKCCNEVNEIHAALGEAQEAAAPAPQRQNSFQEKRMQREVDNLRQELRIARQSSGGDGGGGVSDATSSTLTRYIERIREDVDRALGEVENLGGTVSQAAISARVNIALCQLGSDVTTQCDEMEAALRNAANASPAGRPGPGMDDAERREMEERLNNLQDEMAAAKREIDTKNRELKRIASTGDAGAFVTKRAQRLTSGDYDDLLQEIKQKLESAKQDAYEISENYLDPLRDTGLNGIDRNKREMMENLYEQIEQTVEKVNDQLEDVMGELDGANDLINRRTDDLRTMYERRLDELRDKARTSVVGTTRQLSGQGGAGISSKAANYKAVIQDLLRQLQGCKNQCAGLKNECDQALERIASTPGRSSGLATMAADFNIVLCRLAEFVAKTSIDVDCSLGEVIEELGSCEKLLLENDQTLQDLQAQLETARQTASSAEGRALMAQQQHLEALANNQNMQVAPQPVQASSFEQSKVAAATGFFNDLARIKAMAESAMNDADEDQFRDTTRIIAQKNQLIARLEVELEENKRLLMEKDQTIHSVHNQLAQTLENQTANVHAAVAAGAAQAAAHQGGFVSGWKCDLCGTMCGDAVTECLYCGALKKEIATGQEPHHPKKVRSRGRKGVKQPDSSDSSSSDYEDEDTLAPLGGAPKTQHKGGRHRRNMSIARYQQELGGNAEDTEKAYELVKAARGEFKNLKVEEDEDLPLSEEARNFVKLFRKHDRDGTGTMSAEQLTSILVQHPDIHLDPEQVREIVMLAAEVAGVKDSPAGEQIYYVKFANFLAPTSKDDAGTPESTVNNQQLNEQVEKWKSKYHAAKAQLDSGTGTSASSGGMDTRRILDLEQERENLMQRIRELEVEMASARRLGGGGDLMGVIQRKDVELESMEKVAEEHGDIIRKFRNNAVEADERNEALRAEVQKATAQADQYEKLYHMTQAELSHLSATGATTKSLMELLAQRDVEMSEQERSYMEVINNLQAQVGSADGTFTGAGLGVQKKLLDIVTQKDKEIEDLYKRLREAKVSVAGMGNAGAQNFDAQVARGADNNTMLNQLRQKEVEIEDYQRVIQQKEAETDDIIKQETKRKDEQIQSLMSQLGLKQGFSSQKMWEIIQAKDQEIADLRRRAGRRETSATLMTVIQDKDAMIQDLQRRLGPMGAKQSDFQASPLSQMNSIREAKAITQVQEIRQAYKEAQQETTALRQEQEAFAMQMRQRDESLTQKQQIINALQRQIEAYNTRIEEIENEKRRAVQDIEERHHSERMAMEERILAARREAMASSQAQLAKERADLQKQKGMQDGEQRKELQNMDEYHRSELALRDEKLQIVRAELEDARVAMRQHQHESTSVVRSQAHMTAQIASARAAGTSEVDSLQQKISQLQRQLNIHNNQSSSLQGSNSKLQDNMGRMQQAYQQQIATLQAQVSQLRELHNAILTENVNMKTQLGESDGLKTQLEQTLEVLKQRLLQERAEFDRERQAMDRDYDAFKQFHAQFKQVVGERERMGMEVVGVKNEMQSRTNIMEQQLRALQGETAMKDDALEKLHKQCEDLRGDSKRMQRQIDNTDSMIADLKQSKQLIIAQTAEETQRLKEVTKELTSRLNSSYTFPWSR